MNWVELNLATNEVQGYNQSLYVEANVVSLIQYHIVLDVCIVNHFKLSIRICKRYVSEPSLS